GGAGADGEGVDDRQAHRGGAGGGDTGGGAQRGGHAAGPAPDDDGIEMVGGGHRPVTDSSAGWAGAVRRRGAEVMGSSRAERDGGVGLMRRRAVRDRRG